MSKFKQGDKVRYIGENDRDLRNGNVYEISVPNDFVVVVEYGSHRVVDVDDVELLDALSATDPTTAFLTELQALMRKYDARIEYYMGDHERLDAYVECFIIHIGETEINYRNAWIGTLTPDNIFDYEK